LTIRLDADMMSRFFSFAISDEGNASVIRYDETSGRDLTVEEKREINL